MQVKEELNNLIFSNWLSNAQSWTALFRAFSSHWQPSASLTKLFPSCFFFFITELRETNRIQHVTIIFNVNQILYPNQVILLLLRVLFFVATKLQKRNKNTTYHKLLSNQI